MCGRGRSGCRVSWLGGIVCMWWFYGRRRWSIFSIHTVVYVLLVRPSCTFLNRLWYKPPRLCWSGHVCRTCCRFPVFRGTLLCNGLAILPIHTFGTAHRSLHWTWEQPSVWETFPAHRILERLVPRILCFIVRFIGMRTMNRISYRQETSNEESASGVNGCLEAWACMPSEDEDGDLGHSGKRPVTQDEDRVEGTAEWKRKRVDVVLQALERNNCSGENKPETASVISPAW